MKEVKTKSISKNIKKIDRAAHLSRRVKSAATHTKQRAEAQSDHSPAQVYAQEKVTGAAAVTTRKINDTVIRAYKITREHRWGNRKLATETGIKIKKANSVKQEQVLHTSTRTDRSMSSVPPRVSRSLRLKKPLNGKYIPTPLDATANQRFIQSRAHARLLHRLMEPTEKNSSLPNAENSVSLLKPHQLSNPMNRSPLSADRLTTTRHAFKKFKSHSTSISPPTDVQSIPSRTTKKKSIKTLAQSVKTGKKLYQTTAKSVQTAGAAAKTARRTAQTIRAAHKSAQTARATMKLTLRMIRIALKTAALLAKGLFALVGASSSLIIILVIILAVAALFCSPFGLFFSSENKDIDVKPATQIVQDTIAEFAAAVEDIKRSFDHVDRVEMHYPGSADNTRVDNWPDIMAVFAVRTTMDAENGMDVATLDATREHLIRAIFWDMNQIDSYVETIEHTGTKTIVHEDGSSSEETTTNNEYILHITVTSKTAEQQSIIYGFTDEQDELMNEMLSEEFRPLMYALLGKDEDTGLTTEQLEYVNNNLPEGDLGSEAVKLALTRLGDPYSQPKAGQDDYTDCSYLVQWCYRQLGISLPRTAAEQARYCVENGLTIDAGDMKPGDLIFWSYEHNGRFMDITHVGIYAGDGRVVDASSSRGQVVYRELFDSDKQILVGRLHLTEHK